MVLEVVAWDFRASDLSGAYWMAELRAVAMRPDLERLDRYDSVRVRRRFLDAFVPAHTRVIVAAGEDSGLIALRAELDAVWLEHFYLAPSYHGLGMGHRVLTRVMADQASPCDFSVALVSGLSRTTPTACFWVQPRGRGTKPCTGTGFKKAKKWGSRHVTLAGNLF